MISRSILVNFNSLPSSLDSLMPDNGLINLSASLNRAGHQTLILDFCTVSYIKHLITDEIHKELAEAYFELNKDRKKLSEILPIFKNIFKKLENRKQEVINEYINKRVCDKISDFDPHFVGFKLWSGEGFLGCIEIAKMIKKRFPKIKLIAGGPHNDFFHEHTFDFTDVFDILAYGECEETIVDLAQWSVGRKELDQINNIIYKKNGSAVRTPLKRVEDLDESAEPIYDPGIYPSLIGNEKVNVIMIDESRGCPNNCHFCPHPKKSGRKWRKRNPDNVVKIIKDAKTKLNTYCFRLAGSNPPADLMEDICKRIIANNLNIHFVAFGHGVNDSGEYYHLLKKAGCSSLFFGVESGNREILRDVMNKRVSPDRMKEAILKCKSASIGTTASVIVPAPGETLKSLYDTYQFLVDTSPDGVSLCMPGVFPGAEWYINKEKYGLELADDYFPRMMAYTIRFMMPPPLWDPFPFTIDGKDFTQQMILGDFLNTSLEKKGILTGINDVTLLFAQIFGLSIPQMRDLNREMFITGNAQKIEESVIQFNRAVSAGC
ncbi:MAG: radical SAM protein [Candidatus Aminicenantes bacterium]|nr:MAG: radical SAM protein [Candidatus Aminicenantes bacterium]